MNGTSLAKALVLATAAAVAVGGDSGRRQTPGTSPRSNLDYWMGKARTAPAATATAPAGSSPFAARAGFARPDALPAVIVLSDGRVLAGGAYTTRDRSWEVWVPLEKRWRHVPPILVLSITAVVVGEEMDAEWRWKEMGFDEKVYTGRTRPKRRTDWRFRLIDGSHITGSVKGQPIWIDTPDGRRGPFVLHERALGKYGQSLQDLVYVRRVVISRRAMQAVIQARRSASQPARRRRPEVPGP